MISRSSAAPDHPWVREHPEWLEWRPDGTIRYAENPPKKYEDIVNVAFYAPGAASAPWEALRDVVRFWIDQGVRIFRVDNPHTKPLPFWEWLLEDISARDPDVIFLAEAFTRPTMMYRLAKVGFSQSYTYFTWRNTKYELTSYFTELANEPVSDFFRPHLFVSTPDINPFFLQTGGRPAFLIRAALACTLSGLWGMYNGFEVCESRALQGREEYDNSEKYEIRAWDWDRPGNIRAEITSAEPDPPRQSGVAQPSRPRVPERLRRCGALLREEYSRRAQYAAGRRQPRSPAGDRDAISRFRSGVSAFRTRQRSGRRI